jgi:hydroxyacylglutathione hydrolase
MATKVWFVFALTAVMDVASAGQAIAFVPEKKSVVPTIVTFKLSNSNVHLILSARPVLVDAGSPQDWPALANHLALHQVKPCDIAWLVITHAHQDHAGLASQFQKTCGTRVAMHKQDLAMAAAGGFDPHLRYTRWVSRLIWKLVDFNYPAFTPQLVWDLAANESVSLDMLGLPGLSGRVVAVPGHTAGSVAVVLADGRALTGDLISGGALGGALYPTHATEHYFHGDAAGNYRSVRALINQGVHTFYVGHGGPLARDTVLRVLTELENKTHNDELIHSGPPTAATPHWFLSKGAP